MILINKHNQKVTGIRKFCNYSVVQHNREANRNHNSETQKQQYINYYWARRQMAFCFCKGEEGMVVVQDGSTEAKVLGTYI